MPHRISGILRAVSATPWAILPEKLDAILDLLALRASGGEIPEAERQAYAAARTTQAAQLATASARGGSQIAVLPLYGVISQRMNLMAEFSGGTSTEQFAKRFDALLNNPEVSAIVLDVDSPGGTVEGCMELAQRIYDARGRKPIVAISNSCMASAAYWIGSAADEIVASPSGLVGSIGVFTVHTDVSGADAKAGLARTVIRAGRYKAEELPFSPLSAEAQAAMQAHVDEVYDDFVGAVAKHRGVTAAAVRAGYGEGRVLTARAAVAAGLADRVATLDEVIADLSEARPATRSTRAATSAAAGATAGSGFFDSTTAAAEFRALAQRRRAAVEETEPEDEPDDERDDAPATDPDPEALPESDTPPVPLPELDPDETSPVPSARGGAAGAAHSPPHVPARRALEHTVHDTAPVASREAATTAASTPPAASEAQQIAALAREHGMEANLTAWITEGRTLAQVRDAIMATYAARAEPVRASVGTDRATQRPFASFGEQLQAIRAAHPQLGGTVDPRLYAAASGMSQGVPSEGGFLVTPQFSSAIWDRLNEAPDNLLGRTDNYTVDGEYLEFPANAETSRANGSRYGGVQAYWIAEAEQIPRSRPKFRTMRLEPQQLAVLVYATEKLLKNSPIALEQYVNRAAVDEINFCTGDALVRGQGVGKPKGFLNSGAKVVVGKETGQAAATINERNVSKMWARLHPRCRANAVWLHNVDVEEQLDAMTTTVKNVAGTENVGGFESSVFDRNARTLKGRPLIPCEFAETLGTEGDLILADLGTYATGTRGGIESAMSMHVRFEYAEQAFRFMFEVDGQNWLADALTPYKGSKTLTNIVTLATRA